jgi:hypothetical protein
MRIRGSLQRRGCVLALVLSLWPTSLLSADWRDLPRLRSVNAVIARLIAQADRQSITFHRLLDDIARTDGLVYVDAARCGHGVRACLPHSIIRSGPFRLLRIFIDPHDTRTASDAHLIGVIAHELQHALEILSNPAITDDASLYMSYHRETPARGVFETAAAILAGDRVTREMAVTRRDELKLAKATTGPRTE